MKLKQIFYPNLKERKPAELFLMIAAVLVIVGMLLILAQTYLFPRHSIQEVPIDTTSAETFSTNNDLPLSGILVSPQGVDINLYVAKTDEQRVSGLSGFLNLKPNTGMLFVFPQMGIHEFWMKNMNFPIDIIWIDDSYTIVDRVINADPNEYPKTYTPKASALYALEIPANTADAQGFVVGKKVSLRYVK